LPRSWLRRKALREGRFPYGRVVSRSIILGL
jgi:hypothetical protein